MLPNGARRSSNRLTAGVKALTVHAALHAVGAVNPSEAVRAIAPSPASCGTLTELPPEERPMAQASPIRSDAVVPVARTKLARTPI